MDGNKFDTEAIFEHIEGANRELTSNILVEEVLLEHKDIFAIAVLYEGFTFYNFSDYNKIFVVR